MFDASIEIELGDGAMSFFWTDRWLSGRSIQSMAPDLVLAVNTRTRRRRTVSQALVNKQWIRDLTGPLSVRAIVQYLHLWPIIRGIQLRHEVQDKVCWRWTASQQYTAKSAYEMIFCDATKLAGATTLWKTWAPAKVKMFMFLALHGRTWTAERRKRHGLQDDDTCAMCDQLPEHVDHLLPHCATAKEIWWLALSWVGLQSRFSNEDRGIADTWQGTRVGLEK